MSVTVFKGVRAVLTCSSVIWHTSLPALAVCRTTCGVQERLTCQEAMAHPYFAPVREREAERNEAAAMSS
jgi:hypothetical protein